MTRLCARRDDVRGMTAAERYAFDVNGYLVRPGALTPTEVAALNAAVEGLRLPPPRDSIASQRFSGHLHRSPAFVSLLDHPAVVSAFAADEYLPCWADLWPAARMLAKAILREPWAEHVGVQRSHLD